MMRPAWVVMRGPVPLGIALSRDSLEQWIEREPDTYAVRVPYPDVPYYDPDDEFNPDDAEPDDDEGWP